MEEQHRERYGPVVRPVMVDADADADLDRESDDETEATDSDRERQRQRDKETERQREREGRAAADQETGTKAEGSAKGAGGTIAVDVCARSAEHVSDEGGAAGAGKDVDQLKQYLLRNRMFTEQELTTLKPANASQCPLCKEGCGGLARLTECKNQTAVCLNCLDNYYDNYQSKDTALFVCLCCNEKIYNYTMC